MATRREFLTGCIAAITCVALPPIRTEPTLPPKTHVINGRLLIGDGALPNGWVHSDMVKITINGVDCWMASYTPAHVIK